MGSANQKSIYKLLKTEIEAVMPGIFCSKLIGIPKPRNHELQVLKKHRVPVAQE
jgi:hypothetical protein